MSLIENHSVHFRFSKNGIFPTSNFNDSFVLFSVTIQTPSVSVPIYARACLPPTEIQIWQNSNNDRRICDSLSSTSPIPCTFNVYPCDGENQRGDNYFLSIPSSVGIDNVQLSILVNSTVKAPRLLNSTSIFNDSLVATARKEYVLPFNATNLQFLMINFRLTVNVSVANSIGYLSFNQNFGDIQPIATFTSAQPLFPGLGFLPLLICKRSQIVAARALGPSARIYATHYAYDTLPQYSIQATVITTNLVIANMTLGTQSVSVAPGQFKFLRFTPTVDRNVIQNHKNNKPQNKQTQKHTNTKNIVL